MKESLEKRAGYFPSSPFFFSFFLFLA